MAIVVKTPAVIKTKQLYGNSVALFELEPARRTSLYKAGQFLHLAVDPYDPSGEWPESRVFSICNAPNPNKINILVSAKGEFTKRLIHETSVGDTLWLKLPYGEFSFHEDAPEIVLIAGGTGIAPYIAFLEQLMHSGKILPVTLYYGVRSKDLLIFEDFFQQITANNKWFKVNVFIENSDYAPYRQGVLPIMEIRESHPITALFYLSGPEAMIHSFRETLVNSGLPANQILIDDWN